MYHTIVRRQVQKTFDQFNRGDFVSMQKMMAPHLEVHQMFQREHALGGNRHTKEAAAAIAHQAQHGIPAAAAPPVLDG